MSTVNQKRVVACTRLFEFVQVLLKVYGMGSEFFRKKLEVGRFSCLQLHRTKSNLFGDVTERAFRFFWCDVAKLGVKTFHPLKTCKLCTTCHVSTIKSRTHL